MQMWGIVIIIIITMLFLFLIATSWVLYCSADIPFSIFPRVLVYQDAFFRKEGYVCSKETTFYRGIFRKAAHAQPLNDFVSSFHTCGRVCYVSPNIFCSLLTQLPNFSWTYTYSESAFCILFAANYDCLPMLWCIFCKRKWVHNF